MATREEKRAYLDGMFGERGYALDCHKMIVEHDFEVLQVALDLGTSREQVLQAVEITPPQASVVACGEGFDARREVANAGDMEPTVEAHDFGQGRE